MSLKDKLAEAQLASMERMLDTIDRDIRSFSSQIAATVEKYLQHVTEGTAGGHEGMLSCQFGTVSGTRPLFDEISAQLPRLAALPSLLVLSDYCAAPGIDAAFRLRIEELHGDYGTRTRFTVSIDPTRPYADSAIETCKIDAKPVATPFARLRVKAPANVLKLAL